MPLPKNDVPKYSTTLPISKKKVEYRPFLVKEGKLLHTAKKSKKKEDEYRAIKQIISNCTFETLDVETLNISDFEHLFTQIFIKSKGSKIKLAFICSNEITKENKTEKCNTRNVFEIDLEKAKVEIDKDFSDVIKFTDTYGITLRTPTIGDMKTLEDNPEDGLIYLLKNAFDKDEVYDDFTIEEAQEFFDNLRAEQSEKIEKLFLEKLPRLSITFDVVCKNCGHTETKTLKGIENFFQ